MTKTDRKAHAIAAAINSLECAHLDRADHKVGTAAWHTATACLYDATALLVELGIPMTLATLTRGAEGLKNDAKVNRDIAARLIERAQA